MGRTYAGVLGTLAMVTVVARGLIHGSGVEVTLKTACLCMFLFAAIGWIVGCLADQVIEEAARRRLAVQIGEATGDADTARENSPSPSDE